jgi:hypothetical protein
MTVADFSVNARAIWADRGRHIVRIKGAYATQFNLGRALKYAEK